MPRPLADFYNGILPYASGLTPGANVDWAILDAAIEFSRNSRAVRAERTINVVGGTHTYTVTDIRVTQVEVALYRGRPLAASTERNETARNQLWRTEGGEVTRYLRPTEQTIRLVLIPGASVTGGLVVTLSVAPMETDTALDDTFYDVHRTAIEHGALGRLHMQAKKPWTDVALASYRMNQFGIEIGRAHMTAFNMSTASRETTTISGVA